MTDSDDGIKQINDKCPHCDTSTLQYRGEYYPYSVAHLSCNNCDSTYTLNYKPLWTEDVQSIGCDMIDVMEAKLKERGIRISDKQTDEIYKEIEDFLDQFSTGDYRNQMG